VHLCELNSDTSRSYVAKHQKIINNDKLANEARDAMLQEFMVAKDLHHPNVIRYLNFHE